jgi:tight adherence protein C
MTQALLIPTLVLVLSISVAVGALATLALTGPREGLRRLRRLTSSPSVRPAQALLTDATSPLVQRVTAFVPKSPHEMSRLRQRLARAGYHSPLAPVIYSLAELILPVVAALTIVAAAGLRRGWLFALLGALVAFALPALWVGRARSRRRREITNGLPDALDLLLLCLEAGSGLDQAILKTSHELAISYPALAEEFQMIGTETRAGKSRMEAFQNFAARTAVDEVRAFVAMLHQTDRFGTSLGQALRTHAAISRTRRRQRAEERAAKLGVKMIFPLVFCLFPAFYVAVLGPVIIKFVRVLFVQMAGH